MPRTDRLILGKETRYPFYGGAGWLSGAVWTAAENLAHPGIRSPDRQGGSESHTPTELSQPKGHVQNFYEHTERNH